MPIDATQVGAYTIMVLTKQNLYIILKPKDTNGN